MVPRGSPRTQAIFAAALDLVAELGYDRVTVDAIAARAHASKATIYRRWPEKPRSSKPRWTPRTASSSRRCPIPVRSRAICWPRSGRASPTGDRYLMLMSSLLSAAHRDPDLAAALRSHVVDEELSPFAPIVARAIARGDLPADADAELVHEVGEAMLIRRALVGDPLDDAFLRRRRGAGAAGWGC